MNKATTIKRRFLLNLGMCFSTVFPIVAVLMLLLAATGYGANWIIGGWPVSSSDFVRLAGPLLAVTAALAAMFAYGIAAGKRWSRHIVMLFWSAILLNGLLGLGHKTAPSALAWRAIIQSIIGLSIAAWYFYMKANVVTYFQELDAGHRSGGSNAE